MFDINHLLEATKNAFEKRLSRVYYDKVLGAIQDGNNINNAHAIGVNAVEAIYIRYTDTLINIIATF